VEAAKWYGRYYELAPDDLLGLKKLAEVCTRLEEAGEDEACWEAAEEVREKWEMENRKWEKGIPAPNSHFPIPNSQFPSPAAVLREELSRRTDDRRIVAELLGVPVEAVELGPNLVENGGFERVSKGDWPEAWEWHNPATSQPYNRAAFVGGVDRLDPLLGGLAARVDGFWIETLPDRSRAWAGFRVLYEIPASPDDLYMVSFDYRTERSLGDSAGIWVSPTEIFFGWELFLPPTDGAWRHAVGLSRSASVQTASAPDILVRSWGVGHVWFDNVRFQSICVLGDKGMVLPAALFVIK
jgi:hypothetical protein